MRHLLLVLSLLVAFNAFAYDNPQVGYSGNPVQRNCRITSQLDVNVTSAAGGDLLLAQNFQRRCLIIVNKGATNGYIQVQTAPSSSTNGWLLSASGGAWEATVVPIDAIYGITSTGSTTFTVMEGTYP